MMKSRFLARLADWASISFAASALLTVAGPANAGYVLSEVTIAGATSTAVWDINNGGTIVGSSTIGTSRFSVGFVLSGGVVSTLTGPPGAITTSALGVSDGGVVVGSYAETFAVDSTGNLALGPERGFIYSGGVYTSFSIVGANSTLLRAISPDGRYISGYYTTDTRSGVGFVHDIATGTTQVVSAPDSLFTIPQGMNSAGLLVGGDILAGTPSTRLGFIYDIGNGARTNGSLPGAARTSLRSIDDDGTLAGWFTDASGMSHGFVGSLSSYEQIDFAGASNTFVEGSNNERWLVGTYHAAGTSHGFVARFVPAPGSLALAVVALCALGWVGRRFRQQRHAARLSLLSAFVGWQRGSRAV